MNSETPQGFRDPTLLTRWLRFALVAAIILGAAAFVSSLFQYQLLLDFQSGAYSTREQIVAAGGANDSRQRLLATSHSAFIMLRLVIFLMWIYRVNSNVRHLGASDLEISPGWSVGWFFVPIANFWMPFEVMKELWKANTFPSNWRAEKVPVIVPIWWCLWLGVNLLASVMLFRGAPKTIGDSLSVAAFVIVFYFFAIVLDVVMLAMVEGIYRRQIFHRTVGIDETFA